jgi:hypothetical protein
MSSGNPGPKHNEASFDDVLDLGSIPPPPGVVGPDVHAARTAIAAMPTTLLEELRRAKAEAKRAGSFTNEAPTRPGKDGMRLLRPLAPDVNDAPPVPPASDIASAVTEAIATSKDAVTEAPPPAPPTPPQVVKTPPMPIPAPVILQPPPPPRVITPLSTPAPVPIIAMMVDQVPLEEEEPRPLVRIELLVAFVIVGGAGLVFALLAIADRILSHR